jgi:tetraacyldisaccharide-1-P 4'-kinase
MKQLEKLMLSLSPQATINSCRFNPKTICRQEDNEIVHSSTKSLAGVNVFAFCGLARPEAFISSLQELGANIVGQKFFPDHHWYTERDINFLESKLRNEQTGYLVTTQKDFVKLSSGRLQAKLAYIELETEWLNNFPKAIQTFVDFGHQRRYRSSYPYQSSEKQFLKR